MKKEAGSSQAAWALLTEGVAAARVEAHRLRNHVSRALKLVEQSSAKEHIYEVAGDLLLAVPKRLEALETDLDRTSYALAVLGEDTLRDQLPLSDRKVVDEAVERAKPIFGPGLSRSSRVADAYLRNADLNPPLGYPGGPCQVIERVREQVRQPRTQQEIVDEVEEGEDLANSDAARVYHPFVERGPPGPFKQIVVQSHVQYRMDLRGVTVPAVRAALQSFVKHYSDLKSRGPSFVRDLEEDMARSEVINWTDPRLKLTVVFRVQGKDLVLITTYWKGEENPRPPGDGGCDR